MENKFGATSPHGGETPTNNFSDKVTNNFADMQTPSAQSAFGDLMDLVHNPTEPKPELSGMLTVTSMNQMMKETEKLPKPKPLIEGLWNEHELAALFGISNCGKSILAVEWANLIAKTGRRVLYADFELSRPQFYQRYSSDTDGGYIFSDYLYRVELDTNKYLLCPDFEAAIMEDLEEVVKDAKAEVLIIDNLTFLSNKSEKSDSAGLLMLRLKDLHERANLSSLIVSHTPKRGACEPLDQCSMAGSMRLANFFQVMIGIGRSSYDEKIKYIKSVKYRASDMCYGSDNVIMCQISKNSNFPFFERLGTCEERELLREVTDKKSNELKEQAIQLKSEGKTQREIATILKCSLGKINKLVKNQ